MKNVKIKTKDGQGELAFFQTGNGEGRFETRSFGSLCFSFPFDAAAVAEIHAATAPSPVAVPETVEAPTFCVTGSEIPEREVRAWFGGNLLMAQAATCDAHFAGDVAKAIAGIVAFAKSPFGRLLGAMAEEKMADPYVEMARAFLEKRYSYHTEEYRGALATALRQSANEALEKAARAVGFSPVEMPRHLLVDHLRALKVKP